MWLFLEMSPGAYLPFPLAPGCPLPCWGVSSLASQVTFYHRMLLPSPRTPPQSPSAFPRPERGTRRGRGFCLPLHRRQTEAQENEVVGVGQASQIPSSSLPSFLRPPPREHVAGLWRLPRCWQTVRPVLTTFTSFLVPQGLGSWGSGQPRSVQSWPLIWSRRECLAAGQSIFPKSVTDPDTSDDADAPCGCGGPQVPLFPSKK